jgi:phage/plasmid-like protein (TIGR03299 family)
MAHELVKFEDGKWSIAYRGERPWHGLGQHVDPTDGPQEFMVKSGADFTVSKKQLYIDLKSKRFKVPGKKALVNDRDDVILSIVSDDWHPVQNQRVFEFFQDVCSAGDMTMETAGVLQGGRKVWGLAKVGLEFDLKNEGRSDHIKGYCLLTTHHEYGRSTDGRFTAVRVVCNNTHQMATSARSGAGIVRFDHRRPVSVEDIKSALGLAESGMDRYKEEAEFLAQRKYKLEAVKAYFADLFPRGKGEQGEKLSSVAQTCTDILETQPGADFAPGTWWNAFNAVTFVTDHVMGKSNDNRLVSAWYGKNRTVKARAMSQALELAKAA